MPIGLGRRNGPNFRAGYLRSALGAVDRRRDLQRSIDALLNCDQTKIDVVRLRELICVGAGEVSSECRQTVWALLLDVLPSTQHLWAFVSTQLNNRYLDICEVADILLPKETKSSNSVDRILRALKIANQLERVYNRIPVHIGVIKIFSTVFPEAEAVAFFMYSSYIRSVHQSHANIPDNVFGVCEVVDLGFSEVLVRRKMELSLVLQHWLDSMFISVKLLGSLLPIWERIVLLQSTQFIISVCLALLLCARDVIMQPDVNTTPLSKLVEAAVRDRPVEIIYSKALELDAIMSRKSSRESRSGQKSEAKTAS